MVSMKLKIEGLDTLRENFRLSPFTTLKYLSRAVRASIFEVEKQAVDRNFQFKTPRGARTGWLEKSFSFGRYFSPNGLIGSIGPTAKYAPFVYFGTSRGISPNRYIDRIASAAEPEVEKYFNDAINQIVTELAK